MKNEFDVVIVGAGLSGLAAGIRLAHFGRRVLILEAHTVAGGLASWYRRRGRTIDVGLHAMTNYAPPGAPGVPLTKLLRQLRIPREALGLVEQVRSRIEYPSCSLTFTNDFEHLRGRVAAAFPGEIDGFDRLAREIDAFDELSLDAPRRSARELLSTHLREPLLADMLLTPTMFYGNPEEDDMDLSQFAVMWKSIYVQGFCRPAAGMAPLLDLVVDRYLEAGGELRLGARVEALEVADGRVARIRLAGGGTVRAGAVLSSAGYVETLRLCEGGPPAPPPEEVGRLSFVELVAVLDRLPAELGIEETIVFYNRGERLEYRRPDRRTDASSGVICCPANFRHPEPPAEGVVRVTARASHPRWREAAGGAAPRWAPAPRSEGYLRAKREAEEEMLGEAARHVGDFRGSVVFTDLFTPLTVERFTGHLGGAVYGSPVKRRRGETPVANLFLCGTDQGFLGIVGSMLSGISMANLHCLR